MERHEEEREFKRQSKEAKYPFVKLQQNKRCREMNEAVGMCESEKGLKDAAHLRLRPD